MKIGLLRWKWYKLEPPQWHWIYRFQRPYKEIRTSGCFDDNCNPDKDGCKCNDFYKERKAIQEEGFQRVAVFEGLTVWANGHRVIVLEHISYGR